MSKLSYRRKIDAKNNFGIRKIPRTEMVDKLFTSWGNYVSHYTLGQYYDRSYSTQDPRSLASYLEGSSEVEQRLRSRVLPVTPYSRIRNPFNSAESLDLAAIDSATGVLGHLREYPYLVQRRLSFLDVSGKYTEYLRWRYSDPFGFTVDGEEVTGFITKIQSEDNVAVAISRMWSGGLDLLVCEPARARSLLPLLAVNGMMVCRITDPVLEAQLCEELGSFFGFCTLYKPASTSPLTRACYFVGMSYLGQSAVTPGLARFLELRICDILDLQLTFARKALLPGAYTDVFPEYYANWCWKIPDCAIPA